MFCGVAIILIIHLFFFFETKNSFLREKSYRFFFSILSFFGILIKTTENFLESYSIIKSFLKGKFSGRTYSIQEKQNDTGEIKKVNCPWSKIDFFLRKFKKK